MNTLVTHYICFNVLESSPNSFYFFHVCLLLVDIGQQKLGVTPDRHY
jgi:hypothetical protein